MFDFKLFAAVVLLTSAIGAHAKCYNSAAYTVTYVGKEYTCSKLRMPNNSGPRWNLCQTAETQFACPHTCGECCEDSAAFLFAEIGQPEQMRGCDWIQGDERVAEYCNGYTYDGFTIRSQCQEVCNFCFTASTSTPAPIVSSPSAAPTTSPSSAPIAATTSAPTATSPTSPSAAPNSNPSSPPSPVPTRQPSAPTSPPSSVPNATCGDGVSEFPLDDDGGSKACTWFGTNLDLQQSRLDQYCGDQFVAQLCSESCGYCSECTDDSTYEWDLVLATGKGSCAWLTKNSNKEAVRKQNYCTEDYMGGVVKYRCPASCDFCGGVDVPSPPTPATPAPSLAPVTPEPTPSPTLPPTPPPTPSPTLPPSPPPTPSPTTKSKGKGNGRGRVGR